ncbi:hypothetical protein BN988_03316 [Oceanobacillus picturae]|uniref:Uncharacterized protein n=1 Tax=Oceanobacillus picturae TaxID=171693 RepID=W9BER4_9BACI|nr:hypothetical protein BN988_03316 [Oceanobacillus picturae]
MSHRNKKIKLSTYIGIYLCIFIIIYLGVMFLKHITGGELTWFKTFGFMFGITAIYLFLRATTKHLHK